MPDFERWAASKLIFVIVDDKNPAPNVQLSILLTKYGFRIIEAPYSKLADIDFSPIIASRDEVGFFVPDKNAAPIFDSILSQRLQPREYQRVHVLPADSFAYHPGLLVKAFSDLQQFPQGLVFAFLGQLASAAAEAKDFDHVDLDSAVRERQNRD